jgi:hypothetical protein
MGTKSLTDGRKIDEKSEEKSRDNNGKHNNENKGRNQVTRVHKTLVPVRTRTCLMRVLRPTNDQHAQYAQDESTPKPTVNSKH